MGMPDEDAADLLKAAKILTDLNLGDYVYNVRERVPGDWPGSTWDHPMVKDWSWAAAALARIVKKYPGEKE